MANCSPLILGNSFVQFLLPLILTGISLFWLLSSAAPEKINFWRSKKYRQLPTYDNAFGVPTNNRDDDDDDDDDDEDTDEDDDEFAEHLSLRHTVSRATGPELKTDRPHGEIALVVCEELAVLGLLGISITDVAMNVEAIGHVEGFPSIANLISWVSLDIFQLQICQC